ncbi:MAG TPA: flippase-like domain-containing protein [Candidatus Angelobacter sp.]|nr:flippase-like domain-containing protein [Candidatus Angelobacter sp.]
MKRLNVILFLLGCGLFVGLVWTIGPKELWHEFLSLGWGLVPFIIFEGVAEMIHTLGWRHCLMGRARSQSWCYLFRIRMAGYAINYLTPTAALGGEVTRATLLASRCEVSEAAGGVLVGKVCFAFAHLLFVALGLVVVVRGIKLETVQWVSLLLAAVLVACGIGAFLLLQKYGKLGSFIRWLVKRGIGGKPLRRAAAVLTSVDEQLIAFYRNRPGDLFLAIGWHLVGYSMGIIPTWFFLHSLHPSGTLITAATAWILGMGFDLLTFAIPLNAGSLEGSRILCLKLLGYAPAAGMIYGFAQRLGQLFWAAAGLVFYATFATDKKRAAASDAPAKNGKNRWAPATDHESFPHLSNLHDTNNFTIHKAVDAAVEELKNPNGSA